MKIKNLIFKISLLPVFVFFVGQIAESFGQTPTKIVVHETSLRKKAVNTVVPEYPKQALKEKVSGVAVAEIVVSEEGTVINVKILESPHKSINLSMKEALKKWRFKPYTIKGIAQKVTGKITFYFVIENEKSKVESPYKI